MLLLTFLALCIPAFNAVGTLTPYGTNPIDASIANKDEVADYTFYFAPDTTIPAGGALYVIFPTQYIFGLGIAVAPVCSVTCTISGFTAIFFFDEPVLNSVATSVTITSVANPTQKGGTGNFQLISRTGDNILDQNLVFGVIGIADTIGVLTSTLVSLDSTGVLNAGEVTKYAFSFKVSQSIPAKSYMKFTFLDANFGLSQYPSCNAFSINGKIITGKLTCETVGQEVYVRGLSADIPASQDVGISVSVTNPPFSGLTDQFAIAIFRDGTNAIYDRRLNILGIPITAGKFSNVQLVKVDSDALQARNKVMDYILTFLPKNALKLGSVITLTFPSTFTLDTSADSNNYVRYGLEDISEDVRVDMKIASGVITLAIFQAIEIPQEVSLKLRLINPDNIGTTTPIYIRTYTDSTLATLIDEDTTNAATSIRNLPSPTIHSISGSTVATSLALSSLEFNLVPSITVLAAGVIQIRVPDGFTVGNVLNANCFIKSVNSNNTYYQAGSCRNVDNLITLTLPNTYSFPLGNTASFRLDNVVTTPVYNGTFLFDVTTYKSDGVTPIESWTDSMVTTSVPFALYNTKSLCIGRGLTTVLTVSFTAGLAVPAGITQLKATDTKGFIELQFTGITSAQLGTTSTSKTAIPCRANSGLTPISEKIKCNIYPGTSPTIRVENFKAIPAGTVVSVSFPKILNPPSGSSFTVYAKTIKRYNRVRTELNAALMTVSIAAPVALTESGPVGTYSYVFTSNKVSTFTNITFNPGTSTDITGPGTFILEFPSFDIGWIPHSNTIGCKLATQYFPCTRYDGADWITIELPAGQTLYSLATVFIKLENVQVPRYADPSVTGILLRYIMGSNSQERVNRPQQFFQAASVPQFYEAALIVNKKSKGAVNAEYTMVFAPPNDIPDGGVILITFPTEYNLLSSYPPVKFSSPDLMDLSSTLAVTFTPNVQTLTISNFKAHSAKTSFTVVVQGLKNPSTLATSTGWKAEVLLNSKNMVSHSNFDQFVFTNALSAGTITFNSVRAFPLNAGELADYTISFVPATEIPAGGEIRLTFPTANFNSLPSPPDCRVSEGITTFSRCSLSGNTYTIELDQAYTTGGISLMIRNVQNPDVGVTDGFIVRTYYDGTFLDNTNTGDFDGRTVTIVEPGDLMTIKSLSINPRNEGEQAAYTFVFLPTNTITTSMEIQFRFPDVYDLNLGIAISCTATSGLDGDVTCNVYDRVVTASGFDEYIPDADTPITLSIFGVVNPNQNINSDTGYIRVATLETNTDVFIDYNSEAGVFEPLPAPGWSPLFNISATNLYTRLNANYTFNFTSYTSIPSTAAQGAIFVDFPSEFILATKSYGCESNTPAFSSALNCYISRNRVAVNGHSHSYTGNVIFKVQSLLNPVEEGTAGNIVLKTYDGFNKQIIERSYKNLDPFTYAYEYPGPQITVNDNNPIRVERGTQTKDLYITLEYPCALNLTLKPTAPGFSVLPYNIDLSLGEISTKFRVSVPQNFAEGTYYIEWQTLNEQTPPFYTPLKKTTVIVTRLTNLRIEVPTIYEIPFGGNSLPSYFTAEYGPDIGFEISMNFDDEYAGIQLDKKNVIFRAGQQEAPFIIYSSNDSNVTGGVKIDRGTVSLTLAGINKDVYALSESTIDFLVVDADPIQPDITELTVTDVTKNTATLIIGTSEICIAYYMIALAGTPIPPVDEVINQGPAPYETTLSRYGIVEIGKENRVSISLTGLIAETPYQVYVFVYDKGGNTNDPRTETFTTLTRYNAADFSLKFKQSFLNSAERDNIITTVAFVLSLFPSKVQEKKYSIVTASTSRLLQKEAGQTETTGLVLANNNSMSSQDLSQSIVKTDENLYETIEETNNETTYMLLEEESITINLQIKATPESSVYLSPKNLALLLNDRNDMLTSRLTNFDSSYVITATEFTRYIPAFPSTPTSPDVGPEWATITAMLNNYGYLFAVFLKASEDFGKPSPYQVLKGYNSKNVKNPSGFMEISKTYKEFTMNITGLDPLTDYNVYIVAGSAHPGYPDLMAAESIIMLPVRTDPAPVTPHLNINGGSVLKVAYIALIVSMILAIIA